MSKISNVSAREILASNGLPTIETTVTLDNGISGTASVAYGVSAGIHEASMLFDNDQKRFMGNGVLTAIENIKNIIAPKIIGLDPNHQVEIDKLMIELDGTANKNYLGGNAILSVSLAVTRAAAADIKIPLYQYIGQTFSLGTPSLPRPLVVVIEGGRHADHSTDFQEYLVACLGEKSVSENIRSFVEVYYRLKTILSQNNYSINVGTEGAFVPQGLDKNDLPFNFIEQAINESGYKIGEDFGLALDAAASEFYKNNLYNLKIENKTLTSTELIDYYTTLYSSHKLFLLEDLLDQDDWENWPMILSKFPNTLIVGDDLTVSNALRLQKAIDTKSINSIIIKLNQVGTLTETIETCTLAKKNNIKTIVSHRGGGETNDTFMIDLAVAVGADFVKVGPTRGERVAKYNRLMEIESSL